MTKEEVISCFHRFMDNEPILIPKLEEAMQAAIKDLEQLQKIQGIIESWENGTIEEKDSIYAFHKIREVLKDGNKQADRICKRAM